MLQRVLRIFISGIRAKLALFTGSLITLTILILSISTVKQQTEILTESYEKQAAISKRYISSLVVELNNIAQNLIQIEEFRRQIAEQRKALKVYQTQRTVEQDKKIDLGLFKTNLFGALGTKKVRYTLDTFYSRYLNESELKQLESRIKAQIGQTTGKTLAAGDWNALQAQARRIINTTDPATILALRAKLDSQIAALLLPSRKKIIEETGLEKKLFRIQTFPVTDLTGDQKLVASFDTNLLGKESPLAALEESGAMEANLKEVYQRLVDAPESNVDSLALAFEWNGLEIQTLYSPLYQRPVSTTWARTIVSDADRLTRKKDFAERDRALAARLAEIIPKLKARLKLLKEKKPPQPPYSDRDFRTFYKEYSAVVEERRTLYDEVFAPEQGEVVVDMSAEAVKSLRDSAWEDSILLRYRNDDTEFDRYVNSRKERDLVRRRWAELRRWVSEAQSETAPPYLKRLFQTSQIAKSRSEAEEILWEIDGKPLFVEKKPVLAITILQDNLTAIMRTLVDRTSGVELVRTNRNKVLISAVLIGLVSILLAIYISGIVVQKIKRIIRSAEEVGRGNLNVEFEHGGSDEFGNLTVALNQMVSGLNEREKIKGILGSMIDPVVVSEAMKDLQALKRGSEKEITAFFSDVASFSNISEKLTSPQLADLLNEYLSAMTIILKEHEGVLDKYIGDAIVGIFNSPVDVEDHAYKAVMASIKMERKLAELRADWTAKEKYIPEARAMTFRIGLNTGVAKVGFMGTDALASYTMMGDTVNLAARLEAAAKDYGVTILATDAVFEKIQSRIFTRRLDVVRVKGKNQPVTLYQIICEKGKETVQMADAVQRYEQGLAAYLQKSWDAAMGFFKEAQRIQNVADNACQLLLERCESYKLNPPPADWDGVYTRTTK
ncbi:MAG: adenylate/guanylate cyclase domain-containing protein [Turneriella sp.]